MKPEPLTYATRISIDDAMSDCSNTLLTLLAAIPPKFYSTLPAAMIGQIVTGAVHGQSTSLQLTLTVLLNPQKHLVDQFHKFGVTSSYDELWRFRISVAIEMTKDDREITQFDIRQ